MTNAVHTLANGIRVHHKPIKGTRLLYVGLILNVGSRDETEQQLGMAHMIEHMVFKGTQRRKAFHILNRIDSVGGELNAYTTKDKTVLHATVTAEHAARAFELLADMAFASTFPERELEKEKAVIAEEIDMYDDDPEETIHDRFDELIFPGHPLGHPILGSKQAIQRFTAQDVRDFVSHHYGNNRMVLSVVGRLSPKRVHYLAEKFFGHLPATEQPITRQAPKAFHPTSEALQRPIQQTHLLLGGRGYALPHDRSLPFWLLINYLGGPSMNARLNMAIRERYGLTYALHSYYQPYTDTGVWGIYAASEPASIDRVRALIGKELKALQQKPLSTAALHRIKRQFRGSLILQQESFFGQMLRPARDLLDFDRLVPIDELLQELDAITPAQLQAIAQEAFNPTQLAELRLNPA